ncbi:MAG: leucyl/phenylalanyl-tRNA--protein transferase [Gammaproteobacteria bacterium]|nr:leucyl/phenylalanyl-tRNA--protein transferase [Gammaproteobacteria bacterium]NNJ80006.1 leucyl/phenylalanyl-tRNA--protein transferase [Xanthomonadales bacterium]
MPRLGDEPGAPFPPSSEALDEPNGLLAGGGDLSSQRLLNAYRRGIFPWYSEDSPILWWSPAPRCVLYPQNVYISSRTRRRFNTGRYRLSVNRAFPEVIRACAEPRPGDHGTWITPGMEQAYIDLHGMGHAHSLEVWTEGKLAGGIYGIAIGSAFFGESMFSGQADGSKIALIALCKLLTRSRIGLLDCQVSNPHLIRMGAVEIDRERFESELSRAVCGPDRFAKVAAALDFEHRW